MSNVNVYDSVGELYFTVKTVENERSLIEYTLRESLSTGDRNKVTVEFTRTVKTIGGNQVCRIGYKWNTLPTSYQVIVKLPKNSSLKNTSVNPSETYTKNESLYMRYSGVMTDSFQTHILFTTPSPEEGPPTEGEQPPREEQEGGGPALPTYVILSVIAVIALLITWGIRRVIKPSRELEERPRVVPRPSVGMILRMLRENERNVVEILLRKDNLTQAELCGKTDIPKATMSRILQGLEQKGVVRRVRHGMSKKVMLAEWMKEEDKSLPQGD